jgi:hypothetical protein
MNDNFTTLLVVLAMISVVSWVIVGVTVFVRFAARLRYRHRHSGKMSSTSHGGQA